MICESSKFLFFDGFPKVSRTFNTARFVQSVLPCVPDRASLHTRNVFPIDLSRVKDEAIAGIAHQNPALEACGSCLGSSLMSSRPWRNVYSAVANVVPEDSSESTDGHSDGVRFNVLQEAKEAADLFQGKTEELRQAIVTADYEVKPTPYTPVEGVEAVQFYATCAMLVVAFWVGNYWVPNLIFKDTVFQDEEVVDEFTVPLGDTLEDQVVNSQQRLQSKSAEDFISSQKETVERQTAAIEKVVVGFGKGSDQISKRNRSS
ncbi:hypothetical protein Mapa_013774 [Marchantia paleacea]|nr:hypothetical protein Mapa_013774 [Marchantia paleacea]